MEIYQALQFNQVPTALGVGNLEVQIQNGVPLQGTINLYIADTTANMLEPTLFNKAQSQNVSSGSSIYNFSGNNTNAAAYLVILADEGIDLQPNYLPETIPSLGINGIGIANPYVSEQDAKKANSAANEYATSLANDVISGKRHFKDIPNVDDILTDLESFGFPNDLITSVTTPILDEYAGDSTADIAEMMRYAETVRKAKKDGIDTPEMYSTIGCYACRIAFGITLIVVIVAIVAILIVIFAITVLPGGAVISGSLAAAFTTIAISASTTLVVSKITAGLILAVGASAGIGVMMGQLPRIICEAIGECPPAIGTWVGGDSIDEIKYGPDSLPAISAFGNTIFVVYSDDNNVLRLATQDATSGDWSSGTPIVGAPPTSLGATIVNLQGTFYLITQDLSNSLFYSTSSDCLNWATFIPISLPNPSTPISATVFNDMILLAYTDSYGFINLSYYNQIHQQWTGRGQLPESPKSNYGPSITVYNDTLYIAYQDEDTDQVKFTTSPDGLSLSNPITPNGLKIDAGSNLCISDCDDYLMIFNEGSSSYVIHWSWFSAENNTIAGGETLGAIGSKRASQGVAGIWYEPLGSFFLIWKNWTTSTLYSAKFIPSPKPVKPED